MLSSCYCFPLQSCKGQILFEPLSRGEDRHQCLCWTRWDLLRRVLARPKVQGKWQLSSLTIIHHVHCIIFIYIYIYIFFIYFIQYIYIYMYSLCMYKYNQIQTLTHAMRKGMKKALWPGLGREQRCWHPKPGWNSTLGRRHVQHDCLSLSVLVTLARGFKKRCFVRKKWQTTFVTS